MSIALAWLHNATVCFSLARDVYYAKQQFEVMNAAVPAIFETLPPSFFYEFFATHIRANRSLLRDGLDIETLSLSTLPPVLRSRFPDLTSDLFPKDSDSKQADELFGAGEAKYDAKNFGEAAGDFFSSAVSLDMKCETDLCRDGLWLWRAHAVWNGVTSLRQMKDSIKACEEAKKFVVLAGEGHQKFAAADVEDALCSGLSN